MAHALLLGNLGSTLALSGLIWTVQLVLYPLFARVGTAEWPAYHRAHMQSITWVVAPLMAIELVTSIALVVVRPAGLPVVAPWIGVALVAVVWTSTALVQVPQHAALEAGHDTEVVRALVRGNWLRTAAWTARAALVLWMYGIA